METNLRKRIRAGDHDAFGELFGAYARSVCNHASVAAVTVSTRGPAPSTMTQVRRLHPVAARDMPGTWTFGGEF